MRLALIMIAALLAGCSAEPAAPDAAPETPAPHAEDGETAKPPTAYEVARDTIAAQGKEGADAAWAAGRPAMLLFSASW